MSDVDMKDQMIKAAWDLISQAYGGDWETAPLSWQKAAADWTAAYSQTIHGGTPGSQVWLIWSVRHQLWWKPGSAGYTTNPWMAGSYTGEEAQKIISSYGFDGAELTNVAVPRPHSIPVFAIVAATRHVLEQAVEKASREAIANYEPPARPGTGGNDGVTRSD